MGIFTIQFFALPPSPSRIDALIIVPLALTGVIFSAQSRLNQISGSTKSSDISQVCLTSRVSTSAHSIFQWAFTPTPHNQSRKSSWSAMGVLPAAWRPHLQTILHTPTSKRIFYFLLLNLAYMGVQMAYGVLTNSLGLISDGKRLICELRLADRRRSAIHMLFDCLGLGVGLWASVAATWKPDGRYTYGYSRVETLSGFANGTIGWYGPDTKLISE
jgi:zinc transporter 5/7